MLSDFGANHSTAAALTAGLDLEFLSTFFSGLGIIGGDPTTAIKFQLEHGLLDPGVVDRAVRHILTSMAAFHLLDGASPTGAPVVDHPRPPLDPAGDADIAEQIARAGAVLLKNDRDVLPLGPRDLRSLAVIGPTAKAPLLGGGGSAHVAPFPGVHSPLDALVARAGSSGGIVYQAGARRRAISGCAARSAATTDRLTARRRACGTACGGQTSITKSMDRYRSVTSMPVQVIHQAPACGQPVRDSRLYSPSP